MREILFRGKRLKDGQWETGLLSTTISVFFDESVYIIDQKTGRRTEVIPETVGQFTGLTDKNGKMIFEGDICLGRNEHEISDVVFRDGVYMLSMFLGHQPALWEMTNIEVIGNIYDNPELMGGE